MKSPIGSPKKADVDRFQKMQSVGCVACYIDGQRGVQCDVHHVLSGGRRIGHQATIGLCPWHHRGISNLGAQAASQLYGPSFARDPRQFKERYGTEVALLKLQNELLEGTQ